MRRTCTICSSRIKAVRSSKRSIARRELGKRSFELVLVRHGRTAWNEAGRYQGHSDIPLDDVGRRQAADVARGLAANTFSSATSSDLARAKETARIILGPEAANVHCDPRWREMHFGAWEGLTREQILSRRRDEGAASTPRFMQPEGGETFAALVARIAEALAAVAARTDDGGRALVVTHAGPLHAVLQLLLGEPEAAALGVKFSPAAYTSFAIEAGRARLVALNREAVPAGAAGTGSGGG